MLGLAKSANRLRQSYLWVFAMIMMEFLIKYELNYTAFKGIFKDVEGGVPWPRRFVLTCTFLSLSQNVHQVTL